MIITRDMITTKDVSGPLERDKGPETVLHLVAANGTRHNYSLFALNLREVPKSVALHGVIYENIDANYPLNFVEKAAPKFTTTAPEHIREEKPAKAKK